MTAKAKRFNKDVGKAVRRMRAHGKLSQRALGKAVGLSQAFISMVESGKRSIRIVPFARIADACGCAAELRFVKTIPLTLK